jgi:hypothetical protein
VRYYRDRLTNSIYSSHELGGMVDREEITLQELLVRFEELTADKRQLLEETEAAAARARGEHRPAWFHFWG